MSFGIDKKTEACSLLAAEYSELAQRSGQDKDEAYGGYMDRCLNRDEELICEQVLREAYHMLRKDSSISWVSAYAEEKAKRKTLEVKYANLKELNFL
jgi:predicted nucleic acid-binding protein